MAAMVDRHSKDPTQMQRHRVFEI